jgi:REP element-mobilizing transposase RayT
MPRSLRIERDNGVYHLINRGNYRQDLFVDEGTHRSFETCLFEACEKCGWVLEGFCVMTNHFHLVVRTPKGNLIYGMKWLQSTFANRYHRYRNVNGKLFQGRYKSLIVEESTYLRGLLHYVHLNPVRAGICPVSELKHYRWSSYWYLHQPRRRSAFMDFTHMLDCVGGVKDTPRGRQKYADYLAWVAADDAVQRELAFEKMTRGWALGSKDFKREVLAEAIKESDPNPRGDGIRFEGSELAEINELIWERVLERGLSVVKKTRDDIVREAKSVEWKVAIACALKRRTSAPNNWIADELNMGVPQAVSMYVGRFRAAGGERETSFLDLIQIITE